MNVVTLGAIATLNSLWQGLALALLVWLALRQLSRVNAATRHLIWWIALAAVLVLPVIPRRTTITLPATPVAAPAPPRVAALPIPVAPPYAAPPPETPVTITGKRSTIWPYCLLVARRWYSRIACRRSFAVIFSARREATGRGVVTSAAGYDAPGRSADLARGAIAHRGRLPASGCDTAGRIARAIVPLRTELRPVARSRAPGALRRLDQPPGAPVGRGAGAASRAGGCFARSNGNARWPVTTGWCRGPDRRAPTRRAWLASSGADRPGDFRARFRHLHPAIQTAGPY